MHDNLILSYFQGCNFCHLYESIHIRFRWLRNILDTRIPSPTDANADQKGSSTESGRISLYRLPGGSGADAVAESLGHSVLLHALHPRPR